MNGKTCLLFLAMCGCLPSLPFHFSQRCNDGSDCDGGKLCLSQRCIQPECVKNEDCGGAGLCRADFSCAQGAAAAARIAITSVTGDIVSANGSRIRSGLIVTGAGFDGSTSVQMMSAALKRTWDLVLAEPAEASTLTAQLPADLAMMLTSTLATDFTLRLASTAGGSATREVSLLQGEKGDLGPTGPTGEAGERGNDGTSFSVPADLHASSATQATLSVGNDMPNSTALAVTAGGVKLPFFFVTGIGASPVNVTIVARCPAGSIAISCSCDDKGTNETLYRVCIGKDGNCADESTPPDAIDSTCTCKWGHDGGGALRAYAQCMRTGTY
jgi:hypothetical protein